MVWSFLAFLLFSLAPAAPGTPASFHDQIVVTASGEPQQTDEVSAAATVIDRGELHAAGSASVLEALRWVPGATVLRSGLDNGVGSLFLRGTSTAQTLVLLDGVRLNSPFFAGYDWSLPLTAGIDRVEIVRGPYSALYGSDAVGGVVQLVSVPPGESGMRALVEGGGAAWRRVDVDASLVAGRLAATVTAAGREGSGPLANDDFSTWVGMADVGYSWGSGRRLGLLVRHTASSTEIPFSAANVTPHRSTRADETLLAVPVRWGEVGGGVLEATMSRVGRTVRFRDPDDPYGFVSGDTEADSTAGRLAWHRSHGRHRVTLGAEWRRDEVHDRSSFGVNLDGAHVTTSSAFVQDQWRLADRIEVVAGARWDEAAPWGREVSPRATVSFLGDGYRVWSSYGRAFRAPSLGELYYPFSGNPELRPERARAFELGMAFPAAAGRGLAQLVAFRNRTDDLIDFDYATYSFANVARAAQDGLELSWLQRVATSGRLRVSLTWLDARDGAGERLLRRPRWAGSTVLSGPVAGRVDGEVALVWVGARADLDPVTLQRARQGGFLTASAATSYRLTESFRVRARVENLADRAYEEVRGYPAPGRRVILGGEVRLK